jgi:rubrerythrin
MADGDVYVESASTVSDYHYLHALEGSRSNTVLSEDGADSEVEAVTRVYHPCPVCGTNLDGHGDPNFCPECGADL